MATHSPTSFTYVCLAMNTNVICISLNALLIVLASLFTQSILMGPRRVVHDDDDDDNDEDAQADDYHDEDAREQRKASASSSGGGMSGDADGGGSEDEYDNDNVTFL